MIEFLVTHVKQVVDCGGVISQLCHFNQNDSNVEMKENIVQLQGGNYFGDLENKLMETNGTKTATKTHYFLNKLVSAADRNSVRDKNGYRYEDEIKQFATYLRMLTGPFGYDTIQRNLECALPAISSTNRYIRRTNCKIVEGVLRCDELRTYLEERDLPLVVALSEDATRINGNIQYDSKTNQMVGFVLPINPQTGMPIPYCWK